MMTRNAPIPNANGLLALEQVRLAPHPVHKVPTLFFHIIRVPDAEHIGEINLRLGSGPHIVRYAGHVGYGIDPEHRGNRYAAQAVRLLIPIAREHGVNPLWLTCDPENVASRRTCELAGAQFVEIVDVPEDCIIRQSGHPKKCRYRLDL
jgi:predicted acetyltransferase